MDPSSPLHLWNLSQVRQEQWISLFEQYLRNGLVISVGVGISLYILYMKVCRVCRHNEIYH